MIQSLTARVSVSTVELPLPGDLAKVLEKTFSGTWHIQLRSLNHRFFELNCQVPEFAPELEIPLGKMLQRTLLRGKIDCRLSYSSQEVASTAANGSNGSAGWGSPKTKIPLDMDLLRLELRQLHDLERFAKDLGLELQRPSSLELLQHCRELQQKQQSDREQAQTLLLCSDESWANDGGEPKLGYQQDTWQQAVQEFCLLACRQLVAARQREGKNLYCELLQLHQSLVEQCQQAQQWESKISSYYRQQLLAKYRQLQSAFTAIRGDKSTSPVRDGQGTSPKLNEERLLSELSLLLAKGDVREELSRLHIHAQRFFEVLDGANQVDSAGETGKISESSKASSCAKELDFLLQEMNRETNTLGSKSPLVQLQQLTVRLKVIIEQMREQAKNVL